ncbi:MAG: hypothetical protein ACJ761_11885 [Chloroflexota bacterium]
MLGLIVRAGLIRMLGRRIIPVLVVVDAVRLIRLARRRHPGASPATSPPPPRPVGPDPRT